MTVETRAVKEYSGIKVLVSPDDKDAATVYTNTRSCPPGLQKIVQLCTRDTEFFKLQSMPYTD